MVDTPNRGYPKFTGAENISTEYNLYNVAVGKIDLDVASILDVLGDKASQSHSHEFSDVPGLQLALDGKANANHQHSLDNLSDVAGAEVAGLGFLLAKGAGGWVGISVSSAVSDVVGQLVDNGLTSRATLESPEFTGTPKAPTQPTGDNSTRIATTQFVSEAIAAIPVPEGLPVGSSIMYNGTSAPEGTLKENGAAYSRTVYAALFAEIGTTFGAGDGSTTFNVPDTRAEFIRGLDDGRGVDVGRVLGVAQGSQNKSHTHSGSTNTTGAHTHSIPYAYGSGSHVNPVGGLQHAYATSNLNSGSAGNHSHTLTINASGGSEARPRNQAKLFCIKY